MKNLLSILYILFTIPAFGQYEYFANIEQNQVYDNVSLLGSNCGPRLQASFKTFRLSGLGNNNINYGYLSYVQPINLKNGNYIGIGGCMLQYYSTLFDNRSGSILTSYNKQLSDKNGTKQFLSLDIGFTLS